MAELKIDIIAGIDKLSASLKEVEGKFSKLGQKLTDIGGKLSLSVTAPILAMGAVAANEFATVEKGLREINSLFGLTGEEAEKNFGGRGHGESRSGRRTGAEGRGRPRRIDERHVDAVPRIRRCRRQTSRASSDEKHAGGAASGIPKAA